MKSIKLIRLTSLSALILSLSLPIYAEEAQDWATKRDEIKKQFDVDGDGELNETERKAAKEKRRERIVKRFDADGDGKLNETEREAAKKAKFKRCKKHAENMEV